eukprot:8111846-Ditylum_brightwellii.AAC.1
MNDTSLFKLLDLIPESKDNRQRLVVDAIIREVQQNPNSTEKEYHFHHDYVHLFPLHKAILLNAPINVLDALSCPVALRGVTGGPTALHRACCIGSSLD